MPATEDYCAGRNAAEHRLNDEVDSEKAQVGDVFHGSISLQFPIDDQTAIPTTADVEGRVVEVKSAGRFAGQSVLTLELTKLTMNGKSYSLQTSQWTNPAMAGANPLRPRLAAAPR